MSKTATVGRVETSVALTLGIAGGDFTLTCFLVNTTKDVKGECSVCTE